MLRVDHGWVHHLRAESEILLPRLGILAHLGVLALFGVLVPWSKGVDFLDPVTAGAYACLGVLFTAPAAAAPLPSTAFGRTAARVAVSVLYGEFMAAVLLLTGAVTVYTTATLFLLPDLGRLATTALFGLGLTAAAAAVAVWVNVRFSPGAARMAMRFVFLGLLAAFFFYSRWLPEIALLGAGVSFAVACLFLYLLWRTPRPPNG